MKLWTTFQIKTPILSHYIGFICDGRLDVRVALRAAIEKIEKATGVTASLPIPATALTPDADTLPRPAEGTTPEGDKLPRVSGDRNHGNNDPKSRQVGTISKSCETSAGRFWVEVLTSLFEALDRLMGRPYMDDTPSCQSKRQ